MPWIMDPPSFRRETKSGPVALEWSVPEAHWEGILTLTTYRLRTSIMSPLVRVIRVTFRVGEQTPGVGRLEFV